MKIIIENDLLISKGNCYTWMWNLIDDRFKILDKKNRVISSGKLEPAITLSRKGHQIPYSPAEDINFKIEENTVRIFYKNDQLKTSTSIQWVFNENTIYINPINFESSENYDLVNIVYFAQRSEEKGGNQYKPSLYSRYLVTPGLSMSTSISPVVDLQSKFETMACLGSGAMRGPGLAQQWGLPSHYFCLFNTMDKWNSINAKNEISSAACWGIRDLPQGDFRLDIRKIAMSPVLNVRSDLWHHLSTPGKITAGFSFVITFGNHYHEAIRNYYRTLKDEKIILSTGIENSRIKTEVILSPQYNTWGVEIAKAMAPEDLTEKEVLSIYKKLKESPMKAETFVIDDKWEGVYGELHHDPDRFPNFENMLEAIRGDGYKIGLWAAFLRCQDPARLGLNDSHLMQKSDGTPLWLAHQTARYGIFDITQNEVKAVLSEKAKSFIKKYNPHIIKFDFGYELPSMDVSAPYNRTYSGERLIKEGLKTVVDSMKEINPDLVVMYYGLSPLLIDYYDLHSPDDLVYCSGDYDMETNRRIYFSSLCGEIGMPTYSSSGYDWKSSKDIWFDVAASGIPGSLHCFDGDENGDMPDNLTIAKYNGISTIKRKSCFFSTYPLEVEHSYGMRAALSSSWERKEKGKSVLIALRKNRLDGKDGIHSHGAINNSDETVVVASMTDDCIEESRQIGLVPFGNGSITLKTQIQVADIIEHYLDGSKVEYSLETREKELTINFNEETQSGILEWIEIKKQNFIPFPQADR